MADTGERELGRTASETDERLHFCRIACMQCLNSAEDVECLQQHQRVSTAGVVKRPSGSRRQPARPF